MVEATKYARPAIEKEARVGLEWLSFHLLGRGQTTLYMRHQQSSLNNLLLLGRPWVLMFVLLQEFQGVRAREYSSFMPRLKQDAHETDRTMQVVNHIRSMIETGTLQAGDKIPPEREFARSLKISRATLRSGIGYLAAMGVMKVRHGVGTFVADGPPDLGKVSLSIMGALHGFQSWQMFEARIILESSLAALAAERGKEEH